MKPPISDIAFTQSVKAIQERLGSRKQYARMEEGAGWSATITPELSAFLEEVDSFYLATANVDGRPYIQHRGGPKGFLQVLDDQTLAFADFVGNRQYISLGNLAENNQAFLFLMDYATQTRIKIWGKAEVIDNDSNLLSQLTDAHYKGKPERVIHFHVEAWDANCRQHIPVKYSQKEVDSIVRPLIERLGQLEAENEILKKESTIPV
jgi:predicted pyridoxine 5'-phosphate oxidase superfamily flavin-nucleotide-binding protein